MGSRRGHGEGSIHQRKDGRWVATVELGFVNGKRRRKNVYGKTRKEVTTKLREVQQDLAQGLAVFTDDRRLDDFLTTWLDEVVAPSTKPRTLESYASVVRVHLIPSLGHHRLAALKPQHVQALLAEKSATNLSPGTVKYIWRVLRRALNVAVKWGVVTHNVTNQVTPPRQPSKEVQPLSIEEVRRIIDEANGPRRYGAAIILAVTTGMRRGEILGLQWSDIDLDADGGARLVVNRSVQRIGGRLVDDEPKSAASRRTIVLVPEAAQALRRHRAAQAEERLRAGADWRGEDFIFTTATGGLVDGRNLLRSWKRLLKEVGIEETRLHDARHTVASLMLSAGVPIKTVQVTLGHSSIQMTADTYGHLMPDDADRAAEAIDRMLKAN